MFAVSGQLMKTPSVRRFKNIQVIITDVLGYDRSLAADLVQYALSAQCPADGPDPHIPGPRGEEERTADHGAAQMYSHRNSTGGSCIPCSRCTARQRAWATRLLLGRCSRLLEQRQMEREYLPEELRSRYELAEYNYAH